MSGLKTTDRFLGATHRLIVQIERERRDLLLFLICFSLLLLFVTIFYGLLTPMISGIRIPTTNQIEILNWDQASWHAGSFLFSFLLTYCSALWLTHWLATKWSVRLSLSELTIVITTALLPFLISRAFLIAPTLRPLADLLPLLGVFIYSWLVSKVFKHPQLSTSGRFAAVVLSIVMLLTSFTVIGELLFGF